MELILEEDIIYKKLISMKNYQEAEKVLLANKITEDLICLVGMNRKSKTYDKIFFQLYQLLKAIFIDKSNQNYLKTFEIISKILSKVSIFSINSSSFSSTQSSIFWSNTINLSEISFLHFKSFITYSLNNFFKSL